MKKEIIKYLNQLNIKDFMAHTETEAGKISWSLAILNSGFNITISNSEYELNKIQISLNINFNNFKTLVEPQEIEIFIQTLRKSLENSWCKKSVSEEKREELLTIFKQCKTIDKLAKESFTKIEDNEEKRYYFRRFDNNSNEKELEQLKFHHFYITEMTRDKRLTNDFYSSKDYDFLISSKELCDIFEIDLQKEKNDAFNKNFGHILKIKEVLTIEDKLINNPNELIIKETITNKIKKIL